MSYSRDHMLNSEKDDCKCFLNLMNLRSTGPVETLTQSLITKRVAELKFMIKILTPRNSREILSALDQASEFCLWLATGQTSSMPSWEHDCSEFFDVCCQISDLIRVHGSATSDKKTNSLTRPLTTATNTLHQRPTSGSNPSTSNSIGALFTPPHMNALNEELERMTPYEATVALIERAIQNTGASHMQDGDFRLNIRKFTGHKYIRGKLKFKALWDGSDEETIEEFHSAIKAARPLREYIMCLSARSKNHMLNNYPQLFLLLN